MEKENVVSLEERIPKLKQQRRRKANRRLIFLLFLFFALIVIVAYIQSPLSRVKAITVKGNEFYSSQEIIQKTGISKSTNIWTVKKGEIASNLERYPEIKTADVGMNWLNSIEIRITEYKKLAYLKKDSFYYPVLENGAILENRKTGRVPINAPILIGFKEGTVLKEMLKEIGKLPKVVLNSVSEIHYEPSKTDQFHITLFMNDGFEVSASIKSFSEKMTHYPSIISQLDPGKKGIIDLEVGSYFKAYAPAAKGAGPVEKNKSTK
ncbi:MAG: FtsQ-type POTRA domain-containing protein [Bacillota bacterium]|nr:FtsQ-type POTRA domain-containing protein [Bacillota bacterium]